MSLLFHFLVELTLRPGLVARLLSEGYVLYQIFTRFRGGVDSCVIDPVPHRIHIFSKERFVLNFGVRVIVDVATRACNH